jgi:hypothetical protein
MVRANGNNSENEWQAVTRANELRELAAILATAIEKARRLHLATSAYILSMALVEISEALKVVSDNDNDSSSQNDVSR